MPLNAEASLLFSFHCRSNHLISNRSRNGPKKKTQEPSLEGSESVGSKADASSGCYVTVSILEVLGILIEENIEKHDASRVAEALRDLFHLLYCDRDGEKADKNKREAQSHGAHASVLQPMAKFETDEAVQVQGCRCISALFYSNGWSICNEKICLQIVQSHGMALVECLAMAAKNFPGCPRLQDVCYAALVNLFASNTPCFGTPKQDASPLDEGTKSTFLFVWDQIVTNTLLLTRGPFLVVGKVSAHFVNELDGIAMVVGAMKQYTDQSPLKHRCCLLLAFLARQEDLRVVVQNINVGSLVGAALDNHPQDAKLVASVKDFFDAMCR